jgi:hypothetical protein
MNINFIPTLQLCLQLVIKKPLINLFYRNQQPLILSSDLNPLIITSINYTEFICYLVSSTCTYLFFMRAYLARER